MFKFMVKAGYSQTNIVNRLQIIQKTLRAQPILQRRRVGPTSNRQRRNLPGRKQFPATSRLRLCGFLSTFAR